MENRSEKSDSVPYIQDLSSIFTPERHDGTSYTEWFLNAENKIKGRKRWGYISGKTVAPMNKTSDEYDNRKMRIVWSNLGSWMQ
ncbi:Gag-polypeptide of LTR copia-type [Sesbania bispinosa]|nr:Gag-polypeptide of LTR copia-type [Sesbania bispinosa]